MTAWRKITPTEPAGVKQVLLWGEGCVCIGHLAGNWRGPSFYTDGDYRFQFTHWQPLPEGPGDEE